MFELIVFLISERPAPKKNSKKTNSRKPLKLAPARGGGQPYLCLHLPHLISLFPFPQTRGWVAIASSPRAEKKQMEVATFPLSATGNISKNRT